MPSAPPPPLSSSLFILPSALPPPLSSFPSLLLFFLILPFLSSPAGLPSSPTALPLSAIISHKVPVLVDPIRLVFDPQVSSSHSNSSQQPPPSPPLPSCVLTLHRDPECRGRRIGSQERIGWDTRICFRWRCTGTKGMAMRVQDCWAGSALSPIQLIDAGGCAGERAMISAPVLRPASGEAFSRGWLTVRLLHLDHLRLSCAIRLCPICEPKCRATIVPKECGGGRREEMEAELEELCRKERREQMVGNEGRESKSGARIGQGRMPSRLLTMMPWVVLIRILTG